MAALRVFGPILNQTIHNELALLKAHSNTAEERKAAMKIFGAANKRNYEPLLEFMTLRVKETAPAKT